LLLPDIFEDRELLTTAITFDKRPLFKRKDQ